MRTRPSVALADAEAVERERTFRTGASIEAELEIRKRVEPLLERHGVEVTGRETLVRGLSIT